MENEKETSVQVTIRIRPQNAREQVDLCRVCTFVTPNEPQVVLGKDKAFTYDYVYDVGSEQHDIYTGCIEKLVEGCFSGFNATVLAYGQTGSGKTYTMGTGFDVTILPEEQGMIPRAVRHLFTGIATRIEEAKSKGLPAPKFSVSAQFLELYNEEIIDLFDSSRENSKRLKIHETSSGDIYVNGAVTQYVQSEQETMEALKRGAVSRTVGSTNMNAQSSRSHAIFTIILKQEKPIINGENETVSADFETLTAKFHFVDLAGSERLKRTGATGDRAKEGISINCGLLALGNVISALGDQTKKGSHVPYRDSKLTRLLQDSLGGNSRTLMIACISPSDRDFMETLNTLKYANRARNIKNKVSVNQDKASAQMTALRQRIAELENELTEFKAGRLVVTDDGSVVLNDLANENAMLKAENDKLRIRIKSLQSLIDFQKEKLSSLQAEKDIRALQLHDESTGQVMNVNGDGDNSVQELLQQYTQQIEDLRAQLILCESNKENTEHKSLAPRGGAPQRTVGVSSTSFHPYAASTSIPVEMETDQVLQIAKENIDRLQSKCSQKRVHKSRSRRRRRRTFLISSNERMSTDVEEWVLKCTNNDSDVMITEGEGSDTEINENGSSKDVNDNNDDSSADEDDFRSDTSNSTAGEDSSQDEEEDDLDKDNDTDDEAEDDKISIATSIAELSTEINIKQQLVEQLEKTQKNLNQLRSQYEEKMAILLNQIKATEVERDKFIKDITDRQSEHKEAAIKEVKDTYEKQLHKMKMELKLLETSRKEHAKALQKNAQQFTELQKVKGDLSDMKRQKIKLLRQLKEETSVMKKKDQKREKELALLKKEHRRKEGIIKTLQADAKRKEIIIRKRNEEVTALRRLQQTSSSSSTQQPTQNKGTAPVTRRPKSSSASLSKEDEPAAKKAKLRKRQNSVFISESARKKWKAMERKIEQIVSRTQMMNIFETDMDHWMKERNDLSQRAVFLKQQREDLLQATEDKEHLNSIDEELEGLGAQISWANDCIETLQDEIVNYEEIKSETSTNDTTALIHTCSTREAKFLLENMINALIELNISYHQKVAEVKSLNARLQTSEQHAELIKIYSSPHAPQSPLVINSRTVSKITSTFQMPHPLTLPPKINLEPACDAKEPVCNTSMNSSDSSSIDLSPSITRKSIKSLKVDENPTKLRRRTGLPSELAQHRRQLSDPSQPPSSPGEVSLDQSDYGDTVAKRRRHSEDQITNSPRRQLSYKKKSFSQISESLEVPPTTHDCPSSPSAGGGKLSRSVDSTSSLKSQEINEVIKGQLEAERILGTRSVKLLQNTHTAKGHTAGILSLSATEDILLSASQDCSVRVWDLTKGQEVSVLARHHSYVRKVVYDPSYQLALTACLSLIKLWDLRDLRNPQLVKTLSPSGQQGPTHLSSADTVVQDMLVTNDALFSASGNIVNVWDMRQMNNTIHMGKLVGHTGTVGTMCSVSGGYIATGSRDRLIKLYDVSDILNTDAGFHQISQATLAPAHYDTVSSLTAHEDTMFSACGVSIKQWNIPKRSLVQTIDGAHLQAKGNIITSLTQFPSSLLLVSACKSGILKLWKLNNDCQPIGEVTAHRASINCVAANSSALFTGSSDKTVKIWRPNLSSSIP